MGVSDIEAVVAFGTWPTKLQSKLEPSKVDRMGTAGQSRESNLELVNDATRLAGATHGIGVVRREQNDIINAHPELLNCK